MKQTFPEKNNNKIFTSRKCWFFPSNKLITADDPEVVALPSAAAQTFESENKTQNLWKSDPEECTEAHFRWEENNKNESQNYGIWVFTF